MSVPKIKLTGDKYFQRNETFKKKFLSILPHIYLFLSLSRTDDFKRT